ncbi:MAG: ribosome small subunit-dependent GTPase A, partial [Bacilli bacterium]
TKTDLGTNIEEVQAAFKDYTDYHYQVIFSSIFDEANINQIKALLNGKLSVLVGQSGSGKSSLLNKLDHDLKLSTNGISKALNRGKHTTRHVEIFDIDGALIADSPGFSSLEIDMLDPIDLAHSYYDYQQGSKQCKFNNCLHLSEPGCHIKEMVATNQTPLSRYEDYLKFMAEIKMRKEKY